MRHAMLEALATEDGFLGKDALICGCCLAKSLDLHQKCLFDAVESCKS